MSRAFTGPTFGGDKLAKETKQGVDNKTKHIGVAREIEIATKLPRRHAMDLAQLMGEDGIACLSRDRVNFEISVLIAQRYLSWIIDIGFIFIPPVEVSREAARRVSSNGICDADIKRTIDLLKAIFNQLSLDDIETLAQLICKPALKLIWKKTPLFELKTFCLKNQQDWLKQNGIDIPAKDSVSKKSSAIQEPQKKPKQKLPDYCETCRIHVKNLNTHIKEESHKQARSHRYGLAGL